MGAIVAAVSKKNENVVPAVIAMLNELVHRGTDSHGIATPNLVALAGSIGELATEGITSSTALGHNLSRIFSRDDAQPFQGEGHMLVFEGRLFPSSNVPDAREVSGLLGSNPERNARNVIKKLDGSYAFVVACSNKVIAGRDTMGTTPLYYGESETTFALASECKALWKVGIKNVKSFPPGNLAFISDRGFVFQPVKTISQPPLKHLGMKEAARRLQSYLLESTKERVSDVKKVAVAFSGGLDCSVIARLTEICGIDVSLISVGLEGLPEAKHAEAAAEALGMSLHIKTYTFDDVKRVLPKVLWLIEKPHAVDAAIAIPLYWAAETASKMGFHVFLTGQGGDELFGGYHRYFVEYSRSGIAAVQNALFQDVELCHERNFQRDNKVCSLHKVELRLPYADREVANFALSLPIEMKIASRNDHLRKRILRRLAQNVGLPPFVVNKAKKAIQYGTGVNLALRRLAKEEGLTPRECINRTFRKVYPNLGI